MDRHALHFGFGHDPQRFRPVEYGRQALDRTAGRASVQIAQAPDAVIDGRIGLELAKIEVFDAPLAQRDLSRGYKSGVKIARLGIDLRYQVRDIQTRRGEVEQQLRVFRVTPPAARAGRNSDQQRLEILKVDPGVVDANFAVQLAQRLQQRVHQKLHVHEIQVAGEFAPLLVAERTGVAHISAHDARILRGAGIEQQARQHRRFDAGRVDGQFEAAVVLLIILERETDLDRRASELGADLFARDLLGRKRKLSAQIRDGNIIEAKTRAIEYRLAVELEGRAGRTFEREIDFGSAVQFLNRGGDLARPCVELSRFYLGREFGQIEIAANGEIQLAGGGAGKVIAAVPAIKARITVEASEVCQCQNSVGHGYFAVHAAQR